MISEPAILADPIARGLGLPRTTVFGLFSGALLLSAVLSPSVGSILRRSEAATKRNFPMIVGSAKFP
jgi:hypothetical protein